MAGIPFIVTPIALGTITTGNQRSGNPATNLGETFYRGMTWRSNGNGSLYVRGDMGSGQAIDFASLMGANAQADTTIRLRLGDTQAAVDGTASYDSGAISFIAPAITRSDGVYGSHLELPAVQTRRWWRIDIGGHTGDFEASVLVLGQKQQPARYYETTWDLGQRDLGSLSFGRNGVPNISPGAKLRSLSYTLGWLTEAESEAMIQPLDEAMGRTLPYFTCFDPEPTVYRQRRSFFGWNEENPTVSKVAYNRYERKYQLLSLF